MNFYRFHIGDYRKDTQGLSQTEHYIYRTLIDECFLTELPLLPDKRELMRLLRLTSDQKDDLEYVLGKFFELTDDGYINDRVNTELSKTYERSEKAKASIKARWDKYERKRKSYERNTTVLDSNNDRNTNVILPNTQYPERSTKRTTTGGSGKRSNGRFKPPAAEEAQAYIDKRKITDFTGEQFCDFYQARGWKLSNGKTMADWKAGVRTWEHRRNNEQTKDEPYGKGAI